MAVWPSFVQWHTAVTGIWNSTSVPTAEVSVADGTSRATVFFSAWTSQLLLRVMASV